MRRGANGGGEGSLRPWLPAPSTQALQLGQHQQHAVHALGKCSSILQKRHSWLEKSSANARAGRAEGRGSACWIGRVAGEKKRTSELLDRSSD